MTHLKMPVNGRPDSIIVVWYRLDIIFIPQSPFHGNHIGCPLRSHLSIGSRLPRLPWFLRLYVPPHTDTAKMTNFQIDREPWLYGNLTDQTFFWAHDQFVTPLHSTDTDISKICMRTRDLYLSVQFSTDRQTDNQTFHSLNPNVALDVNDPLRITMIAKWWDNKIHSLCQSRQIWHIPLCNAQNLMTRHCDEIKKCKKWSLLHHIYNLQTIVEFVGYTTWMIWTTLVRVHWAFE